MAAQQDLAFKMTHIEGKSINFWLIYHFLFPHKHEVIFHFGSYLSQVLMFFAQIWMI